MTAPNAMKFKGVLTAIVTPFKNGEVDEEALRRHIRFQIEGGVQGIVPCGSTGESSTLSHDEHNRVVSIAVEEAAGRIAVLAGAGSNNTKEALDMAAHAKEAGADGLLMVTPYYNKPTPEGLYLHYQAISEAVDLPVMLYNIPGRCGVNILPETMARLAAIPNVVGVKESTGDLGQMIRTIELCGPDFLVTSGDDGMTLPLLSVGGGGIISVASNIIPGPMVAMYTAWEAGDVSKARELFFKMLPLFKALFVETNPMPVKAALGLMGRMEADMRLPMCPVKAATLETLKSILKQWELI